MARKYTLKHCCKFFNKALFWKGISFINPWTSFGRVWLWRPKWIYPILQVWRSRNLRSTNNLINGFFNKTLRDMMVNCIFNKVPVSHLEKVTCPIHQSQFNGNTRQQFRNVSPESSARLMALPIVKPWKPFDFIAKHHGNQKPSALIESRLSTMIISRIGWHRSGHQFRHIVQKLLENQIFQMFICRMWKVVRQQWPVISSCSDMWRGEQSPFLVLPLFKRRYWS